MTGSSSTAQCTPLQSLAERFGEGYNFLSNPTRVRGKETRWSRSLKRNQTLLDISRPRSG